MAKKDQTLALLAVIGGGALVLWALSKKERSAAARRTGFPGLPFSLWQPPGEYWPSVEETVQETGTEELPPEYASLQYGPEHYAALQRTLEYLKTAPEGTQFLIRRTWPRWHAYTIALKEYPERFTKYWQSVAKAHQTYEAQTAEQRKQLEAQVAELRRREVKRRVEARKAFARYPEHRAAMSQYARYLGWSPKEWRERFAPRPVRVSPPASRRVARIYVM